ncbi:MAG: DUF2191 domain-containing protein [Spirochaetes bacterium]|nr:DUF2191 domain-containing protein [Spirochaetota bacterium]
MKTTIDIPDGELLDLMRFTAARTKRDAIIQAIREFNRHRKLGEVAEMLGTFTAFMSQDELRRMREEG